MKKEKPVPDIHETSMVHPDASLDPTVRVGPFCAVGPQVVLGEGNELISHVSIQGRVLAGKGNRFFPFSAIGHVPQDLKYKGEDTMVVIGAENQFREGCTVHIGTVGGGGVTKIGNRCLFMAQSHVAHDCKIGDEVVLANSAALGGHVELENYAIVGGLVGIHQFCRVGCYAMLAAGSTVTQDVPPFALVAWDRARLVGINSVGLKRRGFSKEVIGAIREAFRILFWSRLSLREALEVAGEKFCGLGEVEHLVAFIRKSKRGICRPRRYPEPEVP